MMAYDSARRRTVLLGERSVYTKGSWGWDGRDWTQDSTFSMPYSSWNRMVYDSARQRIVVTRAGAGHYEWDGLGWQKISFRFNYPNTRGLHAMAYDSVRQRIVMFGGRLPNSGSGWIYYPSTWVYGSANLTLTATTPTISIVTGGRQALRINAGAGLGNKSYWIFGSATSTMPGISLTGIHIPLVPDPYTDIAIGAVSSKVFTNFMGKLGATGTATALLDVPANLSIPTGFRLNHAYVVFDSTTGWVLTSSNPVSVEFK